MPEPRKVTGYKVAGYFAEIARLMEDAKEAAGRFTRSDKPPATEREWMNFLSTLLRLYGNLDRAERTARQGMEIVRENDLLETTEADEAIDELIARLEDLRAGPDPSTDTPGGR